jgi:hypothetical protein
MTFEHKMVAGLGEIRAIVFVCTECKSRVVLEPDGVEAPPSECPSGHKWDWDRPTEYAANASTAFVSFLVALKKLRDPMAQRAGFKILLEFDQPKL